MAKQRKTIVASYRRTKTVKKTGLPRMSIVKGYKRKPPKTKIASAQLGLRNCYPPRLWSSWDSSRYSSVQFPYRMATARLRE
jgi:hypothetical protein